MKREETTNEVCAEIFDRLGRMMSALGSGSRLKILQILSQGPRSVETLGNLSGLSVANVSQHLQKMAREGLVVADKRGVERVYRLTSERLAALWDHMQEVAHELNPWLDQAEAVVSDKDLRSSRTLLELYRSAQAGRAVILDVRDVSESAATPIPLSRAVPWADLPKRAGELSRKVPIFVVCRGRYCPVATEAVKWLRKKGFEAYSLRDSVYKLRLTGQTIK